MIEQGEGYLKLREAVAKDQQHSPGFHDYEGKLNWIMERTEHYAEITGLSAASIIDAWEKERTYWYMSYYQDCNMPLLDSEKVRVFDTTNELENAVGTAGFRCPACNGVSASPYVCDSGQEMSKGKVCDWKVYGLFTDLGKGVYVFVKDRVKGERIFMPIAWDPSKLHRSQ